MKGFRSILTALSLLIAGTAFGQDPAAVASSSISSVEGGSLNACKGSFFNPITDPDWNNIFPITIMGIQMGGNSNPPMMHVPPVCVCPGRLLGIPSPGIGITYWQPLYIAEIEKTAGCASSLGGVKLLSGYAGLNSEQGFFGSDKGATQSTRMQLHWYEYPLFAVLDIFKDLGCTSTNGFNLMYVSEIDPTWQSDAWAGIYNPEAGLFANLIAQSACTVDAVAANVNYPLDSLFWCAGTWGGVYPMAGTANEALYTFQLNHLVLAKFLARQARLGLAWQTIGPSAICQAHPSPVWVKSQYRVNQVYPLRRKGAPMPIGAQPLRQRPNMVTNPPGQESTVDLIWQGQQCCVTLY